MKKSFVGVCLFLLLMVALFSTVSAARVQVRISGWGGSDQPIIEEMLRLYVTPALEKEGITVLYEPIADDFQRYIVNALSANTAPDLFYMDIFWAQSLIQAGQVEPLDSYIAKSKLLKKEDFIPSLLDAFSHQGKVYGIPKDFNTLALFYNKDLFDLAGVAYPDEHDTWDTFARKLEAVSKLDGVYGLALQPEFARMGALAYAAGFKTFEQNGKSNLFHPGFKAALEWYTGLAKSRAGIMPADLGQSWGGGAFGTEEVAACIEGAWVIGHLKDQAPNLNYGATFLPKAPSTGKRGNLIFCVAWGMNKESKHKQAAFKVLEQLTSPEVQQWILERGLALPSRVALMDNPYFKQNDREAQANYIVFRGASEGNVEPFSFGEYGGRWMDPINEALRAIMSGELSVEEGLREAQFRLDQEMQR